MVSMYDVFLYTIIFFVSLVFMVLLGTCFKNRSKKYNLPPSPLGLPIIGHLHLLDTFPNRSFQKLSSRYGPIFYLRLGSHPCVVTSSPELAKELLMNNEKKFLTHPASIAIHHVTYESSGFAFCSYGPYWKFMKKLVMSQFLGGSALIHRLVRYLVNKSKDGTEVNVTDELMKLSTNIVTRMMVTNRYSTDGKDAQDEELRNLIREVSGIFGLLNVHDFLDFIPRFFDFQGILKTARDVRRRYNVLLEEIMVEREEARKMKKGDGERDVLDMLLDAVADEKSDVKITRDNVKAVVLDIVTAGTDTSAGAVEWALAELINHPRIFKKARAEIDSVLVGNDPMIDMSERFGLTLPKADPLTLIPVTRFDPSAVV
ncbi:hypothetical protein MKW92_030454 [Papaver armeniacum]|nr:hypothetical protein MKW92_030454 [Papaver armeniacum]